MEAFLGFIGLRPDGLLSASQPIKGFLLESLANYIFPRLSIAQLKVVKQVDRR